MIAIAGGLMYASISPTTIMAQELLPRSQAMAGGLVLGFANGIGGLLVFVNGMIFDDFHDPFAGLLVLIGVIVLACPPRNTVARQARADTLTGTCYW